jgi:uncharacterized membrane protein
VALVLLIALLPVLTLVVWSLLGPLRQQRHAAFGGVVVLGLVYLAAVLIGSGDPVGSNRDARRRQALERATQLAAIVGGVFVVPVITSGTSWGAALGSVLALAGYVCVIAVRELIRGHPGGADNRAECM